MDIGHVTVLGWLRQPLLGVYKVDAKAIANKIKAEVDAKIVDIQTRLKKHAAKPS